jgi:hypothetical protein
MTDHPSPTEFERELTHLINKHSAENLSNTPDFILAHFLMQCLHAWNGGAMRRDQWYKFRPWPHADVESG